MMQKQVTNSFKFKLCLHKAYFEKGLQITTYLKYLVALFSLYSIVQNMPKSIAITSMFGYAVFCYFLGMFWMKKGFFEAEIEVGNFFNLFVREMRKIYKHKK